MKKIEAFLAIAVMFLCLGSCSDDHSNEGGGGGGGEGGGGSSTSKFTGNLENCASQTRTSVSESEGVWKMQWSSGDLILINGVEYKLEAEGSNSFIPQEGSVQQADKYEAFYPSAMFKGGVLTLPSEQSYVKGKVSNLPMYAKSSSTTLEFKNLCSVLAVKVTKGDIATLKSIRVSSSNRAMYGEFTIKEKTEGKGDYYLALKNGENNSKSVILKSEEAITLSSEGSVFYVVVPAEVEYDGIKIELSADGENYSDAMGVNRSNEKITLPRNTICSLGYTKDNSLKLFLSGTTTSNPL